MNFLTATELAEINARLTVLERKCGILSDPPKPAESADMHARLARLESKAQIASAQA